MVLMPITIAVGVEQLHKNWAIATLQYRSEESHAAAFSKTYSLKLAAQSVGVHMNISRSLATRFQSFSCRHSSIAAGTLAMRAAPAGFVHFVPRRPQKSVGRLGRLGQHGRLARAEGAAGILPVEVPSGSLLITAASPAAPVRNPGLNKTKRMCTGVKDSLESFLAG